MVAEESYHLILITIGPGAKLKVLSLEEDVRKGQGPLLLVAL